jgi:hypothetical protein
MPSREGKPEQCAHLYSYMIALCKMGKASQYGGWALWLCLGSSFCVKHYLDFSFVFLSRPASLGHRSQITEGPVLSRFSYTKCTHARQIQCGQYCGPSSSRIVRNSTEHYLRCEESSSLGWWEASILPTCCCPFHATRSGKMFKAHSQRVLNADNTKVLLHFFFKNSCPVSQLNYIWSALCPNDIFQKTMDDDAPPPPQTHMWTHGYACIWECNGH